MKPGQYRDRWGRFAVVGAPEKPAPTPYKVGNRFAVNPNKPKPAPKPKEPRPPQPRHPKGSPGGIGGRFVKGIPVPNVINENLGAAKIAIRLAGFVSRVIGPDYTKSKHRIIVTNQRPLGGVLHQKNGVVFLYTEKEIKKGPNRIDSPPNGGEFRTMAAAPADALEDWQTNVYANSTLAKTNYKVSLMANDVTGSFEVPDGLVDDIDAFEEWALSLGLTNIELEVVRIWQ